MTLELIAVQGCTISHAPGSDISGGTFTIVTTPSVTCSAEGKPIYSGVITFTFAGGSASGATAGTVTGGGTISPTSTKVTVDGLAVIREGDTGTLSASGTNSAPPPPTLPFTGDVEITVAGQTSVRAQ